MLGFSIILSMHFLTFTIKIINIKYRIFCLFLCAASKYYPVFLKLGVYIFYVTEIQGVNKVCTNFKFSFLLHKMRQPNIYTLYLYKVYLTKDAVF